MMTHLLAQNTGQQLWDWSVVADVWPLLMDGLKVTMIAVVGGMVIAATLGLVLAMMRRSKQKWLSWPTTGAIEFIRSTPLLIQLFMMYFVVLPAIDRFFYAQLGFAPFGNNRALDEFFSDWLSITNLDTSALWSGVIMLGIHYSTYASEAYRAGINAVPKGQWEACTALNMSRFQIWRLVILPQAIPPVIPALGNNLVAMFKDTPLLYAILVVELFTSAWNFSSATFRYIEPLTMVGVIFLVLSLVAAGMIRITEKVLVIREA